MSNDQPPQDPNNPYGQPGDNQPGDNQFGDNQFGDNPPGAGQPDYGQPPSYGQPDYGQGAYGQGGYGQGGYGQPPYGADPYGQPAFAGGPVQFSVGGAFGFAWNAFKANIGPFLGLAALTFAASFVIGLLEAPFRPDTAELLSGNDPAASLAFSTGFSLVSMVFQLIQWVVSLVLAAAMIKGALDATRGQQVTLGSMFAGIPWGAVVLAAVLTGIATVVGLVLCIIPGLAVMLFTMFTNYAIIDRNEDAITAIKSSLTLVKDNFGSVFLLVLACIGVTLLGILACLVGLLVAMPLVVLAVAWAFRTLQGQPVVA